MNEIILVVDDEIAIIEYLSKLLKMNGFQVERALSGEQALQIVCSKKIDLLITDMRMPGMDGLEVLRRVKTLDEDIEVVILTGHATLENAVQAMRDGGASDYLLKPLKKTEELISTINHSLERRRLRLENKRLFRKLQAVFEGIPEPLIMFGKDMTLKIMNKSAKEYYGVKEVSRVVGKKCYESIMGKTAPCDDCGIYDAISKEQSITFERKGFFDSAKSEKVNVYFLEDEDNEFNASIITRIFDVTEQKVIEEQMIRADRLASLGQLAGGIAHEIRNPLTGLSLFLEILADSPEFNINPKQSEIIKEIQDNARKIEDIVKRVLALAKPVSPSRRKIDIDIVIEETVKLWRNKLEKSNIRLNLKTEKPSRHIHGDPIEIQQVINNLISNAVEVMEDGGELSIKRYCGVSLFHKNRKVIILKISDTGPGVKSEDAKNIFNPFFTTKPTGTGLGLTISYKIIERHGGIILLNNESDVGATFIIEFPLS